MALAGLAAAAALALSGCVTASAGTPGAARPSPTASSASHGTAAGAGATPGTATPGTSGTPATAAPSTPAAPVDPVAAARAVHANELGRVPVLMYHQIVAHPGADRYNQTPAQFRAEIERLYRENYRPVTATAYVSGHLDIPAGTHPVVLTFDDGTTSQFSLGADGQPKPETAVGILLAVAREHPDFAPTATFYVNKSPFAGQKGALAWLASHGFEVGNHTWSHEALSGLTDAKVREEMARDAQMIAQQTGHAPTTMALPLGIRPRNHALAQRGSWQGISYDNAGVFLVGAAPAPSPFAAAFTPSAIPRIRSQSLPGADAPWESKHWLDWLAAHPDERYTSDGLADVVSFPKSAAGKVSAEAVARVGASASAY